MGGVPSLAGTRRPPSALALPLPASLRPLSLLSQLDRQVIHFVARLIECLTINARWSKKLVI